MEAVDQHFCYNLAVVRGIAASLPEEALRQSDQVPPAAIDLQTAVQQHSEYTRVLKELVPETVVLPADELFPDCVFIEDTAVVADGVALITIPGHESRRGETVAVKEALEKVPGLHVLEMTGSARMDGGDVLFTGREFFVGLSERTNREGITQLAKTFPMYNVLPIIVEDGLHLKSFMSMVGPDRIGIGQSTGAVKTRKQIIESSKFISRYEFVEFPDDTAANCLYIGNNLVHASEESAPNSVAVFEGLDISGKKYPLDVSELGKVDGCLTCSSLLIGLKSPSHVP